MFNYYGILLNDAAKVKFELVRHILDEVKAALSLSNATLNSIKAFSNPPWDNLLVQSANHSYLHLHGDTEYKLELNTHTVHYVTSYTNDTRTRLKFNQIAFWL